MRCFKFTFRDLQGHAKSNVYDRRLAVGRGKSNCYPTVYRRFSRVEIHDWLVANLPIVCFQKDSKGLLYIIYIIDVILLYVNLFSMPKGVEHRSQPNNHQPKDSRGHELVFSSIKYDEVMKIPALRSCFQMVTCMTTLSTRTKGVQ